MERGGETVGARWLGVFLKSRQAEDCRRARVEMQGRPRQGICVSLLAETAGVRVAVLPGDLTGGRWSHRSCFKCCLLNR